MGKTILVVEDEDELRKNIVKMLSIIGFKTMEASNGEDALKTALENDIDLIISDIKMPKKDGYDFLFDLRKQLNNNNIPFIFLTSNIEREQVRKGMNLGADDYITKPFNLEELTSCIIAKLDKYDKLDSLYEKKFSGIIGELKDKIYKNTTTGLPNIEGFNDSIEKIKESYNGETSFVLLNIEIDGSYEISNFFGSNSLLNLQKDMIGKIKNTITPKDQLFHIDDLEFLILIRVDKKDFEIKNFENYAKMILDNIHEPFNAGELELNITASLGLNYVQEEKDGFNDLYKNALKAKIFVQKTGGNNFKVFTKQVQAAVSGQLVLDLKKHVTMKSNINLERNKTVEKEIYEQKIFFLYPQDIIQKELIREIVKNEYEAYIVNDHYKIKKVLKKYPESILFINIDAVLNDKEWEIFIKDIQADPDLSAIRIGIISHKNDAKKEELYLMELLVSCGYVKLKAGFDESLRIILSALEAVEAKGKRKYVRVRVNDDKNVSCSVRINNILLKGLIIDMSSVGMAFQFNKDEDPILREKEILGDIQLLLKGNICHISGVVSAKREINKQNIYVISFDKSMNYNEKEKIHNFIFKALQENIDRELSPVEFSI